MKTNKRKTRKIMKKKTQMGGSQYRYAKFYDIADNVELSIDEKQLPILERRDIFRNKIRNELNSDNKYKVGDILFIDDDDYPFAIVDEENGTLTFALNDNPEYLPFGRMLNKVKAHNVKYQKIFENVNELGEFRELFISDDEENVINDYRNEDIY